MRQIVRPLIIFPTIFFACAAAAQQAIFYPAKGQSAAQQNTDTTDCHSWAQQITGVNPAMLAEQMANSPTPEQTHGQLLRGAGGGALFGTLIGGAAGGHWGEGAGIGALVGTMGVGMRMRRERAQMEMQQESLQHQASGELSRYNRAVKACMTGRGYTAE